MKIPVPIPRTRCIYYTRTYVRVYVLQLRNITIVVSDSYPCTLSRSVYRGTADVYYTFRITCACARTLYVSRACTLVRRLVLGFYLALSTMIILIYYIKGFIVYVERKIVPNNINNDRGRVRVSRNNNDNVAPAIIIAYYSRVACSPRTLIKRDILR